MPGLIELGGAAITGHGRKPGAAALPGAAMRRFAGWPIERLERRLVTAAYPLCYTLHVSANIRSHLRSEHANSGEKSVKPRETQSRRRLTAPHNVVKYLHEEEN